MVGEWLSLSEVAELLGVHPSTVRNWADAGTLPAHRTQGGHRRFQREAIELWQDSQRVRDPQDANVLAQSALGFARMQITEGRLEEEDWYQKLSEEARDAYRKSGRQLMQGLMRYQTEGEETAKREAHAIGVDYASLGRRHGLTSIQAAQAFLFFRNVLQESTLHVFEAAAIQTPAMWGELFRRISGYTDEILLALLETYQAFERGGTGS
jgi:excisionase family DNA binding protein